MKITLLSKIFNPVSNLLPHGTKYLSKSQKLLLYHGLISPSSLGTYTIMPILQRSLDKLINIINNEMNCIDAEKLTMPSLGRSDIWTKSGRWTGMDTELYKLTDKESRQFCLQPTHEEEVTSLLASFRSLRAAQMPILFYQISAKFRNETAPRSGLLRCREFLMKDLYSFDTDDAAAMVTYERVLQQYHRIFEQLDVPFFCVDAHCGRMGGSLSHEFHIPSPIGEDVIFQCNKCTKRFNRELDNKLANAPAHNCISPSCDGTLAALNAIEIGHCFILGSRYSDVFDLHFRDINGEKKFVSMGCYGIGVTRLLSACVESLSENDKIRWPRKLVPFRVAVLLQKEGAHDYPPGELKMRILQELTQNFVEQSYCASDILVDDTNVTIGRKLANADAIGIPWAIVVKDKGVLETVDVYRNTTRHLPIDESIAIICENHSEKIDKSINL